MYIISLRNGNTCLSNCPKDYFVVNNTCVSECPTSYRFVMRQNMLKYCLSKCPSFTVINGSECNLSCPFRAVLHNGTCISKCPDTAPYMMIRQTYYNAIIVCLKTCPVDALIERFTCTDKCSKNTLLYKNSCLDSCPLSAPYVTNGKLFNFTSWKNVYIPAVNVCSETCSKELFINNLSCVDQCPTAKNYLHNRRCISKCPNSHPFSDGKLCVSKCQYFSENGTCVYHCSPNLKRFNKTCVKVCPQNYFELDDFGILCVKECPSLHENKTCVIHCSDGRKIFNKTCINQCPTGYFEDRNYYRSVCVRHCPRLNYQNKCVGLCPNGRKIYNRTCVNKCPKESFQLGHTSCVTKCPNVHNGSMCLTTCPNRTKLYNGTCVDKCPPGFKFMRPQEHKNETICYNVCPNKTFVFDDICYERCPKVFKFGFNNTCISECPKTHTFHIESNFQCVSRCPENKVIENNVCKSKCSSHFKYLVDNVCNISCSTSSPAPVSKYYVNPRPKADFVCKRKCVANMKLFNNTCVHNCPSGYYTFNKSCEKACPMAYPYALMNAKELACVSNCPNSLTDSVIFCEIACEHKLFLFNDTCVAMCPLTYPFTTNDGSRRCLHSCPKHLPYHLQSNICVSSCPSTAKFIWNSTCLTKCPISHPYTYSSKYDHQNENSKDHCHETCNKTHLISNLTCIPEYECRGVKINGKCSKNCPKNMYRLLNSKDCVHHCNLPMYGVINGTTCTLCITPNVIYDGNCLTKCPNSTIPVNEYQYLGLMHTCKKICDENTALYNGSCVLCSIYDMYKYGDQCVKECPDFTYKTDSFLKTCTTMYQQLVFLIVSVVLVLLLLVVMKVIFFQTEPDETDSYSNARTENVTLEQKENDETPLISIDTECIDRCVLEDDAIKTIDSDDDDEKKAKVNETKNNSILHDAVVHCPIDKGPDFFASSSINESSCNSDVKYELNGNKCTDKNTAYFSMQVNDRVSSNTQLPSNEYYSGDEETELKLIGNSSEKWSPLVSISIDQTCLKVYEDTFFEDDFPLEVNGNKCESSNTDTELKCLHVMPREEPDKTKH